jgi:hypothetical protein
MAAFGRNRLLMSRHASSAKDGKEPVVDVWPNGATDPLRALARFNPKAASCHLQTCRLRFKLA